MKFIHLISVVALWSCSAEWSENDKSRILNDCKLAAERMGEKNPSQHCQCVLDKFVQRYPDPNQFENMEMGEFGAIVMECMGKEPGAREIWPQKTQQAFLDSCASMAKQQGKKNPEPYCSCVLKELMEKFPTNDDVDQLNPEIMQAISVSCE